MCCRQSPQITKLELHSLYIRVCFAYLHLSRLLPWQWGDRACLGVRGFPLQSANNVKHYNDVIIGSMASQKIISFTIVYSAVYSGADQRTHHPPRHWPLRGSHRGPVNSPHKWPVTRKMFPFDDVIMMRFYVMTSSCFLVVCYSSHLFDFHARVHVTGI